MYSITFYCKGGSTLTISNKRKKVRKKDAIEQSYNFFNVIKTDIYAIYPRPNGTNLQRYLQKLRHTLHYSDVIGI